MQQRASAGWEARQRELLTEQAPTLLNVIPVGRDGDFDGGHWWVTSIERWSNRTFVHYAIWIDAIPELELTAPASRRRPASRHHVWFSVEISDDCGTSYGPGGGGALGGSHWRSGRSEARTTIPAEAATLTLVLQRHDNVVGAHPPEPPVITTLAEMAVPLS